MNENNAHNRPPKEKNCNKKDGNNKQNKNSHTSGKTAAFIEHTVQIGSAINFIKQSFLCVTNTRRMKL